MKFVLPELPQPSIVLAGVRDNPDRGIEDTLQRWAGTVRSCIGPNRSSYLQYVPGDQEDDPLLFWKRGLFPSLEEVAKTV